MSALMARLHVSHIPKRICPYRGGSAAACAPHAKKNLPVLRGQRGCMCPTCQKEFARAEGAARLHVSHMPKRICPCRGGGTGRGGTEGSNLRKETGLSHTIVYCFCCGGRGLSARTGIGCNCGCGLRASCTASFTASAALPKNSLHFLPKVIAYLPPV